MCIDYAKLYVSATEFFEKEHDIPIDDGALSSLKKRMVALNFQSSDLTDIEIQEITNIFLIVSMYERDDIWENCSFNDQIAQIRDSLQNH